MKIARACQLALCVVVAGSGVLWPCKSARSTEQPAQEEWLPLAKGNFWVYQGVTKWTEPGGKIREETLTCRMEITEVIRHGDSLLAAAVKGYPADLAWYKPGQKPGNWLIVRVGSCAYHLFSGEEAAKTLAQIRAKDPKLYELVSADSVLLDTPLVVDKRYGPYEQTARGEYCWRVGSAEAFAGEGITGLAAASHTVYEVSYRTRPDHTIMGVVPGVGIVSYQYGHHGTVSETELKLIEVHLEKP